MPGGPVSPFGMGSPSGTFSPFSKHFQRADKSPVLPLLEQNPYAPGTARGNAARNQSMSASPVAPTQEEMDIYDWAASELMKMYGQGTDTSAIAEAAAAAYNPAIGALQAERGIKIKRNKKNKQDVRENYKSLENEARLEARAEARTRAQEQGKVNRDMTKGVQETSSTYNKMEADQTAELQRLGLGGSTQALARQELERQAESAVDNQKAQAQNDAAMLEGMSKAQ